jgi:DNA-binding CsgD family transcriptional regulator
MDQRLRTDYSWTARQRDVLDLISRGKTNPEIAAALGVSLDGAKYHVSEILSKLGSDSREEAAEYWRRHNGIAPRFARVFRSLVSGLSLKWAAVCVVGAGIGLAVAAVLLTRGDGETPAGATATVSPSGTPSATATAGIAGKDQTGDPRLDAVIQAVLSGDRALMESFVQLQDVPCGFDFDSGNRMNCGTLPTGTLMPAFAHVGCDEVFWTPDGQYPWIDSLQSRSPQLYAVYREDPATANPPTVAPRGSAVALFQTQFNGGFAIDALDGKIIAERGACGPFPYSLTNGVQPAQFILLPAGGIPVATPTPAPRLTGDAATDRIIRALVDGDIATIAAAFDLYPEPCAANPQGVGSPPKCPTGVPDGGTVQMAHVMACERAYLRTPADFDQLLSPVYRFPHWLYAVYRTDGSMKFNFVPTGKLAIVIAEGLQNSEAASTWYVQDGRLVGARLGCGGDAATAVEGVPATAFIIGPQP